LDRISSNNSLELTKTAVLRLKFGGKTENTWYCINLNISGMAFQQCRYISPISDVNSGITKRLIVLNAILEPQS
jgi:hypothetical protein